MLQVSNWITKYTPYMSDWWTRQSRIAKFGYVAAGGYASLLFASRAVRWLIQDRGIIGGYKPPGYVDKIYGKIDKRNPSYDYGYTDFSSPIDTNASIDRSRSLIEGRNRVRLPSTAGLVQQGYRDRSRHHLMGNARTIDQHRRLFS